MTLRALSVIGLWLVFGAAPAHAVCEEIVPPTEAERFAEEVRNAQAFRRQLGMPASRAHVERVTRTEPERLNYGYAFTPREVRYLRARNRLSFTGGWKRITQYTARHPETFGQLALGNDFPRGGVADVRFTGGVAGHRRALRRLADFPVRVRRVRYSQRRLQRAAREVVADHRALRRQGIYLVSIGSGGIRNRVEIEYISARDDAGRALRRRYGAIVLSKRIARKRTELVCVEVGSATVAADGRTLKLKYFTNLDYDFVRVFVAEEADRVRIAIVERASTGGSRLVGDNRTAEVTLDAPLGDRELVDAQTGEAVSIRAPRRPPARSG